MGMDDQLRRFLRSVRGPGLWIPRTSLDLPSTVAPVKVVVDHDQLGYPTPTVEELVTLARRVERQIGVAWTSRLSITIANLPQPRDQQHQLDLARGFFPDDVVHRLIEVFHDHPDRTLFHRLQLFTLLRLLLSVDPFDGPDLAQSDDEVRHLLGQLALGINSHMERDVRLKLEGSGSEHERRWHMIAFGVRNGAFHHGGYPLDNLIGRSALLWKELPFDPNFTPPYAFSIEDVFNEATGVSLDDYLAFSLLFALAYARHSLIAESVEDREFLIISRDKPVGGLADRFDPVAQRVVDILTARAVEDPVPEILANLYDLLTFRQAPLVKLSDSGLVPVDLGFLQEAATIGVFWIINDFLLERDGEGGSLRWRQYFGPLLEHYVRRLSASAIDAGAGLARRVLGPPDWGVRETAHGQAPHIPDIAILYPNAIVLIEVIATRLHFAATAIRADVDRLQRDLEQMIYQPANQLSGVISDFRYGLISLPGIDPGRTIFYPLIITPETLPQFPIAWEEILTELDRRNIFTAHDRGRLQVWDLHEFETALFLMEGEARVPNLAALIEEKVGNERARFMSLRNLLVVRDFPFGAPSLLRQARQRLVQRLADLMGQKRIRPAGPEDAEGGG